MAELEKTITAATAPMQLRKLTAEDLFKLAEIVEKVSVDIAEKLKEEITDKQMGFTMILTVIKYVPHEIKDFLAHITDQTPEELAKKSFAEPIKILKALWADGDFQDFLQEAKSMLQKIFPKQQT
jgi:hypothetical protein